MQLFIDLGLNNTFWFQLGFFLTAYLFLSQFLFKPYMRNLEYRKSHTHGSLEGVEKIRLEITALETEFKSEATKQNEVTLELFNKAKAQSISGQESALKNAKDSAAKVLTDTRTKVAKEVSVVRGELEKEIPNIGAKIAGRVLGREL